MVGFMFLYITVIKYNRRFLLVRTHLPEPDDLFAAASVVSVDGVSLPVGEVDLLHATQHHLWQETTYQYQYIKYEHF